MQIYTAEEAATRLKVTLQTVRWWLRDGLLRGSKTGRKWLVTEDAIQEFLKKGEIPQKEDAQ